VAKSEAFFEKRRDERERGAELGSQEGTPHTWGVCMSIKRKEMGKEAFA